MEEWQEIKAKLEVLDRLEALIENEAYSAEMYRETIDKINEEHDNNVRGG